MDCPRAVMCQGLYHPSLQIFVLTRQNRGDLTPLTYIYFLNTKRWRIIHSPQGPNISHLLSGNLFSNHGRRGLTPAFETLHCYSRSIPCIFSLATRPDTASSIQGVCVLVAQSYPILCNPTDCAHQAPLSEDSPGKSIGVRSHSLLQGIFPTQGLNPGLLHCRQILYHLTHQGSPFYAIGSGSRSLFGWYRRK